MRPIAALIQRVESGLEHSCARDSRADGAWNVVVRHRERFAVRGKRKRHRRLDVGLGVAFLVTWRLLGICFLLVCVLVRDLVIAWECE